LPTAADQRGDHLVAGLIDLEIGIAPHRRAAPDIETGIAIVDRDVDPVGAIRGADRLLRIEEAVLAGREQPRIDRGFVVVGADLSERIVLLLTADEVSLDHHHQRRLVLRRIAVIGKLGPHTLDRVLAEIIIGLQFENGARRNRRVVHRLDTGSRLRQRCRGLSEGMVGAEAQRHCKRERAHTG